MKEIQLSRGAVAIVDDDDYGRVNQFKWHLGGNGYPVRNVHVGMFDGKQKQRKEALHNYVMGVSSGVDHIDCNPLNCSKTNLRLCTKAENARNVRKTSRPTHSRYKGVTLLHGRWVAYLGGKKPRHLGTFDNEEEAALAYNRAAAEKYGDFARLNVVA